MYLFFSFVLAILICSLSNSSANPQYLIVNFHQFNENKLIIRFNYILSFKGFVKKLLVNAVKSPVNQIILVKYQLRFFFFSAVKHLKVDMKILQYIRLHIKNSITQIAHYNTFHFLRFEHFSHAKCLFINTEKQQNTLKSSFFKKKADFTKFACRARMIISLNDYRLIIFGSFFN